MQQPSKIDTRQMKDLGNAGRDVAGKAADQTAAQNTIDSKVVKIQHDAIIDFLGALPESYEDFEITHVPVSLWPNIFVLDIISDEQLIVRLTGTSIESGVKRNCKGLNFFDIIHGPSSVNVVKAFARSAEDGWSGLMCQTIQIPERHSKMTVTAGIRRIADINGKPHKLMGLMFFQVSTISKAKDVEFWSKKLPQYCQSGTDQ